MRSRRRFWFSLLLALSVPLFLAGCGSSSNPAGEPGGPGVSTVDVSSGNGTVDHTHGAGGFAVYSYPGGGIHMFTGGAADPSFAVNVPAFTPGFGTEPLVVADNLMVVQATTALDDAPADNAVRYYLGTRTVAGGSLNTLWHRQADNVTFKRVTGIQVPAGRVLELRFNYDPLWSGTSWGASAAYIELTNDLEVAGTLRTALFDCAATQPTGDNVSRGGLYLYGKGIFVRSTGKITTAGASVTTGAAGHGGTIRIYSGFGAKNGGLLLNEGAIDASGGSTTDNAASGGMGAFYGNPYYRYFYTTYSDIYLWNYVDINSDGYVINKGTINISGGNGGLNGGFTGTLYMDAGQYAYNTGAVSAKGGDGANGSGGGYNGNWYQIGGPDNFANQYSMGAEIYADLFNAYNSGAIAVNGGNGKTGGGQAGWFDLGNDDDGDTLNKGAVNASGGNVTGATGSPGGGGHIDLWSDGGKMVTSGDLNASGGSSTDNTNTNHGGNGGSIYIGSYDGWFDSGPRGSDEVFVSGNLLAKGGSGYYGQSGGYVEIGNFGSLTAGSKGGVTLYGYSAFQGNGGNAGASGYPGNGGFFAFYSGGGIATLPGYGGGGGVPMTPPGPIVNRVAINANGGNSTVEYGGHGGYVAFNAAQNALFPGGLPGNALPIPSVTNSGAVSVNGGRGGTNGGGGGDLDIVAGADITATGAVSANGGINATDNGYSAGSGGEVYVSSTNGNAAVSGGILLNGGNSQQYGGDGGGLFVESKSSSLSGSVSANGGNSAFSDGSTSAGWGGEVFVTSQAPAASGVSGPITVIKGTGGFQTVGNGIIVIDGVDRVTAGGTFP